MEAEYLNGSKQQEVRRKPEQFDFKRSIQQRKFCYGHNYVLFPIDCAIHQNRIINCMITSK